MTDGKIAEEPLAGPKQFPGSIAIAGAWGYIGRKFLEAAQALGVRTLIHDPGPAPDDVSLQGVTRIDREADFYRQKADLFHLALHPAHRRKGLDTLLRRSRQDPILVLCEKPMADPERPQECQRVLETVETSRAILLYDFPELFDPITRRIHAYLARLRTVKIESIEVQRSKDREDPANPRNYKRIVPVQYQESVHCLAFVLNLLANIRGSLETVFAHGLTVTAHSEPYAPPNPAEYDYVVDGMCEYALTIGSVAIKGRTDFKRGAEWAKRRTIRGRADGEPFLIEVDFLEGRKRLVINDESQDDVTATNSYAEVIKTYGHWCRHVSADTLMCGLYPNPRFARVTYQLSSALWQSSHSGTTRDFASLAALLGFDAGFAAALPGLPRY